MLKFFLKMMSVVYWLAKIVETQMENIEKKKNVLMWWKDILLLWRFVVIWGTDSTMINVLRQVEFWNETFWSRGHVQHFATNTVWHCTTASENSISASDYGTVVAAFKFQVRCFFSIKPAIRPHLLHFLLWWKYSTTFLSCCCNSFWYETSDIFCFIKKKLKSRFFCLFY